MALPLISTTEVQLVRLCKALFDAAPGNTYLTNFVSATGTSGLDAVANWLSGIVSKNAVTLADTVVASLKMTGTVATTAKDYLVAQLNANPTNQGKVIMDAMTMFSNMEGDATFGAAAASYNASVARAYAYSMNEDNSTVNLAELMQADEVVAQNLSRAMDQLMGTSGDDIFVARIIDNANTLQSGDKLNGGNGIDTLQADIGSSQTVIITPETTGIEIVSIRAQATPNNSQNGNNMLASTVQIDAERMSGVTTWESNNSRADVVIEDVRVNSNISTIAFVESDPGNVDMAVYFNQRNLVNTTSGTSTLSAYLMDTAAAGAPATSATPLLNHNFNAFTFYANNILVTLGGANAVGTAINDATTYAALLSAFQLALKTADVGGVVTDLSGTVTASLSAPVNFTTSSAAAGVPANVANGFLNLNGQILSLTTQSAMTISSAHSVTGTAGGWVAAGAAPLNGVIAQAFATGATTASALVSTNIILDDVGMGSMGGDLIVGGMSVGETSSSLGIQRFNIEVRDNSKLQTINSTNDTLREVVIVNGATSSTSTAYVTTTKDAGNLTVRGNVAESGPIAGGSAADDQLHAGLDAAHHDDYGFTDVRLIDASAMTGKFDFNAQITSDAISKYIDKVDTAANPSSDVATVNTSPLNANGKGANFVYTGGLNDDSMSIVIDSAAAASLSTVVAGMADFTFAFNGGAGNDTMEVTIDEPTGLTGGAQDWYYNQNLNNNITVSGGAGNDTIKTPGAGDMNIDAGAGDDVVFTDNVGGMATFLFNTAGQTDATLNGNRAIGDIRSDSNESYNLFNARLTVSFKDIPGVTVTLANTSSYKVTDLEINQAIKNAINNDAQLKKLLSAEDGPANSLVVRSLIDGTMAAGNLVVTLTAPTTALSATELAAANAAWGTAYTTGNELTAMTTVVNNFNTRGDYATYANALGSVSTESSDNVITLGAGNDILVLGTAEDVDYASSSNDVVVLGSGFGDDTIVNFDLNGSGIDYFDVTSILGGAVSNVSGAFNATARSVSIVGEVTVGAAANDTADKIKALFNADAAEDATASSHLYITHTGGVGKVYLIADGTAADDATVTLQGSIDLADTAWGGLNLANFTVPSIYANGPNATGLTLVASAATPLLTGSGQADSLNGALATGLITINGNAGNDAITGGTAGGTLNGGLGNDAITGGAGVDVISGGAGVDVMSGGAGADSFVFVSGDTGITLATADTISDFVTASDTINTTKAAGNATIANGTAFAVVAADAGLAAFITAANAVLTAGAGVNDVYAAFNVAGTGNAYVVIDEDDSGSVDAGDTLIVLTGINLPAEIAVADFV